LIDIVQVA